MIELRNVTKRYSIHHGRSHREVLKGVNLRVQAGERWGILGRNGAGKSTLIRIISGSDKPHSGEVIKTMSVSWPLAFGGTFQGSLTGKDNVRLIARIYDVDYRKTLDLVEDFAELGAYLDEPVKSYSSGMASRLAFAISMSIEFDCFLIDEGMSVGDHRFHQKCNVELFEKRGDRAMIIVAHQTDLIRNVCTHAAVLENGVLKTCETVEDAIRLYESL
ncbi:MULTISPECIES: ABC transporter ATP-binding protein [Burkholderia]|uniref:ATP-binding protein n=1 Tax=Burkholderia cenocepacia TaxID=95486 RepID=A0A071MFQ3_9BURK|nr:MULTISPECIES: ABC transporter ATP-binding protein [Burkholderia]AOJ23959.1 ATP-binding protein [Burkholderia seminalis]KVF50294.1 ATP-binding protein [Burkholderia seminalis]MBN3741359.1 ABC transporter ATP-binding protein [Burkholderia sp. Tr-20355]MCA8041740.1 ABC transporter ATP-binding protein [Burkholderia seminalis]MCA8301554.1 ABC transporter ATP-binding protein [Burkholderia seminalis]